MYVFGDPISHNINDVTPTFLTPGVLGTLRQADHLARTVLLKSGKLLSIIRHKNGSLSVSCGLYTFVTIQTTYEDELTLIPRNAPMQLI